jgi:hypothetical protein
MHDRAGRAGGVGATPNDASVGFVLSIEILIDQWSFRVSLELSEVPWGHFEPDRAAFRLTRRANRRVEAKRGTGGAAKGRRGGALIRGYPFNARDGDLRRGSRRLRFGHTRGAGRVGHRRPGATHGSCGGIKRRSCGTPRRRGAATAMPQSIWDPMAPGSVAHCVAGVGLPTWAAAARRRIGVVSACADMVV